MNKIELIQSLLVELDKLQHRDKHQLDALRRRAEMIIRNVFGENSKYLTDLKNIDFFPRVYPADDTYYNERWLSGKNGMLNLFKTMLEEIKLFDIESSDETREQQKNAKTNLIDREKVFIVHGHDREMKESVARIIEKVGLFPVILHEQPNKGRTIIEKFSDYSDVKFAVVLLSPDDMGYEQMGQDPHINAEPRARQNVVFELGYFIGKLGRERVLPLFRPEKDFELPSDYSGVLYVPYDSSNRWQFDLVKELKACGYDIDANVLLE